MFIGFALCNLDFVLLLDILHRPYKHPTYKPYTAFERPYKPISGGRSLDKPLYIALQALHSQDRVGGRGRPGGLHLRGTYVKLTWGIIIFATRFF